MKRLLFIVMMIANFAAGASGTFVTPERVLFVTLSTTGLHLIPINIGH